MTRIESDADGRVTGATYVQDGREQFCPARAVLLATFTYENTRLLLLSRSPAHPRGLANGSDQVGRHYMAHVTPFAFGRFPGRRLNLFTGLWAQATCIDDWNADNFDHAELDFIGGGLLAASHEYRPIMFAGFPLPPGVPRFGSGWKAWLAAQRAVGRLADRADGVPRRTRTTGSTSIRVARDPHGAPGRARDLSRARQRAARQRVPGRAPGGVAAGGGRERGVARAAAVRRGAPLLRRHAHGRRSRAARSVDRFGFAHDAPNLGVLGTSVYPSSGGHNPTLTLQALAWRTAQHLVERWDDIAQSHTPSAGAP